MSQESRSTLSLRNELLLVVMLSVTFGLRAKDNPYRLPELAAGPSSLFASKHRTLFVQSGTEVLVLDLAEGRTATWKESEIEGQKVYADLAAIPTAIRGISIVTPPSISEQVVVDAAALGVEYVWMQSGAESPKAIEEAGKLGMTVIADGSCILVALGYREG